MLKVFMLKETGEPIRLFETFEAADAAMVERIEKFVESNFLVTRIEKDIFECYMNGEEIKITITELEVEG